MTPEQTAIVARRTIEGVPIRTIAAELGTTHPSVIRAKKKPEVRAYIENEIANLMQRGLKPARLTLCRLAAEGIKAKDKDMLSLSLKASQTILQHANGQPGTIINALIQVNQAPEQSQELTDIQRFLTHTWQNEDSNNRTTVQNCEPPFMNQSIDVTPSHTPEHVHGMNIPGDQATDQAISQADRATITDNEPLEAG